MAGEIAALSLTRTGDGPPVVLLHSLALSAEMWETNARALAAAGFTAITIDARGHGRSPTIDAPCALEDLGSDVSALLDREKIVRPHLVGFSMGGMTAQRIALLGRPLASLTLVSTSGEADERRAQWEPMLEMFKAMPHSVQGADMFLAMIFSPRWLDGRPDVRERYRQMYIGNGRVGVYHASCAVVRRPTVLDRLSQITAPTLVVVGDSDLATPPSHAQRLAAAIPRARLHQIAGTAHMLNEENPEEFHRVLLAHLKENP